MSISKLKRICVQSRFGGQRSTFDSQFGGNVASSPRNDIYRAIINKEFIAQQKDLMRAAEGVVLKTFISNTKTHLEAGEFKGAVAQLANAVSGAKLLDKREHATKGKNYQENEAETCCLETRRIQHTWLRVSP